MGMKLRSLLKVFKILTISIDEIIVGIFFLVILPSAGIRVPLKLTAFIVGLLIIKDLVIAPFLWRVLEKKAEVGPEALIGREAIVVEELNPEGLVKIEGEYWRAISLNGVIKEGEKVKITGLSGLKVLVERPK